MQCPDCDWPYSCVSMCCSFCMGLQLHCALGRAPPGRRRRRRCSCTERNSTMQVRSSLRIFDSSGYVYNTTVPATCSPHTGFAGVWTPATHANLPPCMACDRNHHGRSAVTPRSGSAVGLLSDADGWGWTALHYAANYGHAEVATLLLAGALTACFGPSGALAVHSHSNSRVMIHPGR